MIHQTKKSCCWSWIWDTHTPLILKNLCFDHWPLVSTTQNAKINLQEKWNCIWSIKVKIYDYAKNKDKFLKFKTKKWLHFMQNRSLRCLPTKNGLNSYIIFDFLIFNEQLHKYKSCLLLSLKNSTSCKWNVNLLGLLVKKGVQV